VSTIRVATFNVENLFARFKFGDNIDPAKATKDGWTVDDTVFDPLSEDEREITGKAIKELDADVLCLQEVENVDTLKHFRNRFLGGRAMYPFVAGVDGNDPRLIDVAVLSKLPITGIRSHQQIPDPGQAGQLLFSRDCLVVDVEWPPGSTLTLFVQHLKSMLGGRSNTAPKRQRQAKEVREIVRRRFGATPGGEAFIVCGDFNDYMETDEQGAPAVGDLVRWQQVVNVVKRRPKDDQWTHFFAKQKDYKQLDYMLLSKALADANPEPPEIYRKGMPLRAIRYTGPRLDGVGQNDPKASDHCPVVMTLTSP
jgi:endonuclease/exonuclease/phosphatase family metal-dependent hydrolase